MQDKPVEPMSAENVEDFDVRVRDSLDLVVSIVPLHAPWCADAENYRMNQPAQ